MNTLYGIMNIRVKAIEAAHDDLAEVNDFLAAHDGEIIDIQINPMLYGVTKYIIIFRAW